jgi:type II secretory pathway component GspD/PulD (secretin)
MNSVRFPTIVALSMILTAPAFCGEPSTASRVRPRFVDVPVEALAEAVGAASGKTFVIQPGLHISLTLKSERALSGEELYQEFRRVLEQNGLQARPQGSYIRISLKAYPSRSDVQII